MSAIKNPEQYFFSVPWDNMGKGSGELGSLPEEKKARLNNSVARMNADLLALRHMANTTGNPIPPYYYERAKEMAEFFMDSAEYTDVQRKNTAITIAEESFILDREKARTYYDVNISAQIFEPVTRVMPRFKWDVKHYLIQKVRNVVKFTRNFSSPGFIQLKTSHQTDTGTGWYVGYQIDRWTLLENQGELFDIQYETMLEASAQMGRAANEHILTGHTLEHGGTDDLGEDSTIIKGFCNHGSVQSFSVSTPSTFFNIYKGLKAGLQDLRKVWATDNIVMITTGGIPSQAEVNFATYEARNELDEILKRMVGPGKRIKQWWISDYINGEEISTSTQRIFLVKLDPRLLSRLLILPLQVLPSLKKNWKDDISEVMLAADILRYKLYDSTENAFPATKSAALTTTDLGEITSGRFA